MWFCCLLPMARVHMHNLMITFTKTHHVLPNVHTPFPALPHFWQKKIVSITYGVTWYYQNVYRINDGDYKPSKFRCRAYQSQFALTQMITLDEPEIMVRSAAGATDSALLQCPGRLWNPTSPLLSGHHAALFLGEISRVVKMTRISNQYLGSQKVEEHIYFSMYPHGMLLN